MHYAELGAILLKHHQDTLNTEAVIPTPLQHTLIKTAKKNNTLSLSNNSFQTNARRHDIDGFSISIWDSDSLILMVPFQLEILFHHRMCLMPVCMLPVLALGKKSFVFLASVLLKQERNYQYTFFFFF